ncbi:MAG: hypothetical protein V4515_05005 [Chloroflexota bacterium]
MIAICGDLDGHGRGERLAASIAGRAAGAGAAVQVVGIIPDGPDGDARLLQLAASGIGHAAVLRTRARSVERADLDLALRYLPDVRVVIAAELVPAVFAAVVEAVAFAGASLIVVNAESVGVSVDAALPESAIVLAAPASDPDGTFAGFVAAFAVRLDAGDPTAEAWDDTVRSLAVDAVSRGQDRPRSAADR